MFKVKNILPPNKTFALFLRSSSITSTFTYLDFKQLHTRNIQFSNYSYGPNNEQRQKRDFFTKVQANSGKELTTADSFK